MQRKIASATVILLGVSALNGRHHPPGVWVVELVVRVGVVGGGVTARVWETSQGVVSSLVTQSLNGRHVLMTVKHDNSEPGQHKLS